MKKPLAVLDTNLLISALILPKSKPARLLSTLRKSKFILVTSNPMLGEIEQVLKRPKFAEKYHLSANLRENLLFFLRRRARIIPKLKKPSIKVRDHKDLIVLATALDGKADFLVTGDKDILVLKNNPGLYQLEIVTVAEFLDQIG